MADWKKTARNILLADGFIDEREVAVLRKELFADGKIDEIEMDFLLELRRDAKRLVPNFHFLVIEALKNCYLDGSAIKPGLRQHAAPLAAGGASRLRREARTWKSCTRRRRRSRPTSNSFTGSCCPPDNRIVTSSWPSTTPGRFVTCGTAAVPCE